MMEIKFLQQYQSSIHQIKSRRRGDVIGQSVERITEIEEALFDGKKLPQAVREFLFIGGLNSNIGIQTPWEGVWERFNKGNKKEMEARGILPAREIFVFSYWEETISFIYLDEGDDPQPWNASLDDAYNYYEEIEGEAWDAPYDPSRERKIWKMPYTSFSDCVNKKAIRAAKGIPTA